MSAVLTKRLLDDLRSVIRDVTSGVVTITSHPVANGEGYVWVIRGPIKNPVVMLHYQNDPLLANDGKEVVIANPTSDDIDGDVNPSCPMETTTTGSAPSVLDSCEVDDGDGELPSNSEQEPEATSQGDLASTMSCEETSDVKTVAAQSDKPMFSIHCVESLSTHIKQEIQEPSFSDAAEKRFVEECESSEVDLISSSQQQNEPFPNDRESQNDDESERKIPIVDVACVIKSETTADTISSGDFVPENDVDCQFASSSLVSEEDQQPTLDLTVRSDKSATGNEPGPDIIDVSTIAIRGCSYVVQPVGGSTLRKVQRIGLSAANRLLLKSVGTAPPDKAIRNNNKQCRYCGKVFQTTFECSRCEATHRCRQYLEKHEKVYTLEKPDKIVKDERSKAYVQAPPSEARYRCSFCDMKFAELSDQKLHERTNHDTVDDLHRCSYCEKSFVRYKNKTLHEKIHGKIGLHECSYCDKLFLRRWTKALHEKEHRRAENVFLKRNKQSSAC